MFSSRKHDSLNVPKRNYKFKKNVRSGGVSLGTFRRIKLTFGFNTDKRQPNVPIFASLIQCNI